ncbi:MAG: phosphoglycolate phosphatase [Thaumarchaeota archaeon]|nr:phosphoglycolate phosphatase [Nitrososphaerota archaeon]
MKAVAIDLDGTFFDDNPPLLDLIAKLREVQARGIIVLLCSGRALPYLTGVSKILGVDGPLIAEDGMIVYDQNSAQRYVMGDVKQLEEIRRLASKHIKEGVETKKPQHIKELIFTLEPKPGVPLQTLYEKVLRLKEEWNLSLNISRSNQMVNILPYGANKGAALRKAAKILGIYCSEIAAFGDSLNDLPMLRESGYPVAVGNAEKTVKEIAKYIAKKPDGEGLLEALNALFP